MTVDEAKKTIEDAFIASATNVAPLLASSVVEKHASDPTRPADPSGGGA